MFSLSYRLDSLEEFQTHPARILLGLGHVLRSAVRAAWRPAEWPGLPVACDVLWRIELETSDAADAQLLVHGWLLRNLGRRALL